MEFVVFSIALLLVLLVLIGVVLYLNRQARSDLAATRTLLAESFERSSTDQAAMLETVTSSLQEHFRSTLAEMARFQIAQVQATGASSTASTSAISETMRTQSTLLRDAVAMIATKDPIAFQQVGGGASIIPEPSGSVPPPYTAADEYAIAQQMREQQQAENLLAEAMRGLNGGEPGFPGTPDLAAALAAAGDGSAQFFGAGFGAA